MSAATMIPADHEAACPRWTLEGVAESLEAVPGTGIWSDVHGRGLLEMSERWAFPFFALRHAFPDLWSSDAPVHAVIGGHVKSLTEMGGRGMTLLRRAVCAPPAISVTVWCESALPPGRNVRRDFLLIPPTKVVRKPWEKSFAVGLPVPDVLLLVTSLEPGDQMRFVGRLGRVPADVPTIIGATSTLHAVLVRALLVQCGYTVGDLLEFGSTSGESRAFVGHVWFRVKLDPTHLRPLDTGAVEDWETVCSGLEEAMLTTVFRDAEHARWYGRFSNLVSGGEVYQCLFTGPRDGLCLDVISQ